VRGALCVGGRMRGSCRWRGALVASVAAAFLAAPAWAQNREKSWEVTPEIGWIFYGNPHLGDGTTDQTAISGGTTTRTIDTVTSSIQDSPSYGFRFGYSWTKKQEIEFGFGGTSTTGTVSLDKTVYDVTGGLPGTLTSSKHSEEDVSVDLIVAHINYVYNFFLQHRGKVVAFATGGVGLANSSIFGTTADPDLQPVLDTLIGEETDLMYNYGTGIRFFGGEKVGFRIDARQVRYSTNTRGNQDHIEVGMALTIILGGA
jgi:outer membrane protein with beta-barrel domain